MFSVYLTKKMWYIKLNIDLCAFDDINDNRWIYKTITNLIEMEAPHLTKSQNIRWSELKKNLA